MPVLIDSWAWIEYFKGSRKGEKAKKYIEGKERAIISAINIAEVYIDGYLDIMMKKWLRKKGR